MPHRVLIVEDEYPDYMALRKYIQEHFPSLEVLEQSETIQSVLSRKETIDIMILDISLPDGNGLSILESYKKQRKNIPYTLVHSAYDLFEYAKEAINHGVMGYLLKPTNFQELDTKLKEAIHWLNQKSLLTPLNQNLVKETDRQLSLYVNNLMRNIVYNGSQTGFVPLIIPKTINTSNRLCCLYFTDGQDHSDLVDEANHRLSFQSGSHFIKLNQCLFLASFPNLGDGRRKVPLRLPDLVCRDKLPPYKFAYGCEHSLQSLESILLLEVVFASHFSDGSSAFFSPLSSSALFASEEYIEMKQWMELERIKISDLINNFHIRCRYYLNRKRLDRDAFAYRRQFHSILRTMMDHESVNPKFDEAISYINQHYDSAELSAEMVADSLGISSSYLSHLFALIPNTSYSQFLAELRIRKAQEYLLENVKMKIVDLALMVGYRDASYFCQVFKKITGLTTKEFIHSHSTNKDIV